MMHGQRNIELIAHVAYLIETKKMHAK